MITYFCSITEQSFGTIVACMPVVPGFYRHVFRGRDRSQSGSYISRNVLPNHSSPIIGQEDSRISRQSRNHRDPYPIISVLGYEELDELDTNSKAEFREEGRIYEDRVAETH